MTKWKNINKKTIKSSLNCIGLDDEDKEFINKILDIENKGTLENTKDSRFTYKLEHKRMLFEIVFSKDGNNNTLESIQNKYCNGPKIPFNVLKCTRLLRLWTYLDKNLYGKINNICFKDSKGNDIKFDKENLFINYIAEIFYRKLFYETNNSNTPEFQIISNREKPDLKTLPDIITHLVTKNEKYFKSIDSYIIMDSLLVYNQKRVYCIFEKNNGHKHPPYILSQICTKKEDEILYVYGNNKKDVVSKLDENNFTRNIIPNQDNTLITFEQASYNDDVFDNFWKHITSDKKHKDRLAPAYKKYCESVSSPNEDDFKNRLKEKIKGDIENKIHLQQCIENKYVYKYIENLRSDFFPPITDSIFFEIEFFDEVYYVILSYVSNGRKGSYLFTPITLFTKKMYEENRIKME